MPFIRADKLSDANRVRVAISGTAARNGTDLTAGTYLLTADTDCYVQQGDSTVVVAPATAASAFLAAGGALVLGVDGSANARFSVIQKTTAGALYIQQVTAASV